MDEQYALEPARLVDEDSQESALVSSLEISSAWERVIAANGDDAITQTLKPATWLEEARKAEPKPGSRSDPRLQRSGSGSGSGAAGQRAAEAPAASGSASGSRAGSGSSGNRRRPSQLASRRSSQAASRGSVLASGHPVLEDHDFTSRYQVGDLLGKGGMGTVHLADQRSLDRDVAVKILTSHRNPRHREAFAVESRTTAALEHPNIAPVYDAGELYLVMRCIRGISLDELMQERNAPNENLPRLIDILLRVCDAVAYAHAKGVIHRDLKAANVMVGEYGEVLLVDWGLALQVEIIDEDLPAASMEDCDQLRAGTPGCMPPEVANADRDFISYGTDLFMLGAILYQILTGQLPFAARNAIEAIALAANNEYLPVLDLDPDAPSRLVALQRKAMASHPADRGTLHEFAEGLRAWASSSGLEEAAQRAVNTGRERLRRAMALGRREWDQAYRMFNEAVASFERALGLVEDHEPAQVERERALREFSKAALQSGDIFLARMLFQGQRPPMLHTPSETDHEPHGGPGANRTSGALAAQRGSTRQGVDTTTTRRHRFAPTLAYTSMLSRLGWRDWFVLGWLLLTRRRPRG